MLANHRQPTLAKKRYNLRPRPGRRKYFEPRRLAPLYLNRQLYTESVYAFYTTNDFTFSRPDTLSHFMDELNSRNCASLVRSLRLALYLTDFEGLYDLNLFQVWDSRLHTRKLRPDHDWLDVMSVVLVTFPSLRNIRIEFEPILVTFQGVSLMIRNALLCIDELWLVYQVDSAARVAVLDWYLSLRDFINNNLELKCQNGVVSGLKDNKHWYQSKLGMLGEPAFA